MADDAALHVAIIACAGVGIVKATSTAVPIWDGHAVSLRTYEADQLALDRDDDVRDGRRSTGG